MAGQDTILPADAALPADAVSQEEAMQCWDEAAEEFAGHFKTDEEFFHKYMINPTLLDLLGDVKGKAVLDVACGEGHFSRKLAEQAKGDIQITGIDSSKRLIDIAQKKNKLFSHCIRFLLGDASLLPCFLTPGSGWLLEDSPDKGKGKRIGWKTDNYHLGLVYHGVMTECDTKETYYFCRTLEDYFRALRKSGFVVMDLREPLPPKELMEKHPNFKGEEKRSIILIMKCKLLV
ncbi:MAG: class I SAM-dependent methyltransferase [Thermodesulfobacteriota bacterium]